MHNKSKHLVGGFSSRLKRRASNKSLRERIITLRSDIDELKLLVSQAHTRTLADNHLLDEFYIQFEDTFRGSEEDIYNRLKIYLPVIKKIIKNNKEHVVLDIGSGRGEFLKLASDNKIKAKGVDLNSSMVSRAKERGFDVIESHAQDYLAKQAEASIDVITGFHLIEHIPFDSLLTLFSECHRSLSPTGAVIFETPSPENIITASCKFYYDPSHLHPLPPDLIKFAMESIGFRRVDILKLHPVVDKYSKLNSDAKSDELIQYSMFGPQDYAVIAHK